jgi:hypothetical protein
MSAPCPNPVQPHFAKLRYMPPCGLLLAVLLFGCVAASKGPLSFQLPTGWSVHHGKEAGGLHSYAVSAAALQEGLLKFSQQSLHRQGTKSTGTSEQPSWEKFVGAHCQGGYATFRTGGDGTNRLVVIFIMTAKGSTWTGRFVGPSDAWEQALTMLQCSQ